MIRRIMLFSSLLVLVPLVMRRTQVTEVMPHLGFPFIARPSHSAHPASAFSRPGFSTHTPREFLQRPDRIQPGFDRPLGQAGPAPTEIHHATPEPGEVTIEKWKPWTPAPAPAPATPTSAPPRQSPSRPSPPARRMRLRDILTSALRSALGHLHERPWTGGEEREIEINHCDKYQP